MNKQLLPNLETLNILFENCEQFHPNETQLFLERKKNKTTMYHFVQINISQNSCEIIFIFIVFILFKTGSTVDYNENNK